MKPNLYRDFARTGATPPQPVPDPVPEPVAEPIAELEPEVSFVNYIEPPAPEPPPPPPPPAMMLKFGVTVWSEEFQAYGWARGDGHLGPQSRAVLFDTDAEATTFARDRKLLGASVVGVPVEVPA